ncbi:MAG: hypothetical protein ACK6CT_02475 [Planctomycetia bacterium]
MTTLLHSAPNEWQVIYDLSKDVALVSQVQRATLETEDFGLIPDAALFGSPEWWRAVGSDIIPRHSVKGVISRVFESGDSAWPLFEVDSNGEKTVWTRFGDATQYRVGQHVRIDYVEQRPKKSWTGSVVQNEILLIAVRD